jgi:hypothetical protein
VNSRLSAVFPPILVVLALVALSACSGPALRGDVYRDEGLAFRLGGMPPTWKRLEVKNVRLAFRDDPAESTVLVNARCGNDSDDVPLLALTQHLFILFTERETIEQQVVPMDGREAMHTVMRAKLDGVAKMFDAFVLKKDGCVYDFVVISSPAKFDSSRQAFENFVSGFHTLREEAAR